MKRLLILTDFSETARNAAFYAMEMFQGTKVHFFLLNAYDFEYTGSAYILQVKDEMSGESLKGLKRQVAQIHARFPNERVEMVSRYGSLVDVLLREFHEDGINPDLIVLGCRWDSAVENFLLGSNAYDVIKNVHKPLLAVPLAARCTKPAKLVFATDLKGISNTVAKPLNQLLAHLDAEILFANVPTGEYINRLDAEEQIASFFPGARLSFHYLEGDDVRESVCTFANDNEADIVVLLRHNYSFLERLFHLSITRKMVLQPRFPMLILHTGWD